MRQRGFSLIELMVVVVILAILVAVAFPNFESTLRSNRVSTSANEMLASLALARTEAIRISGLAGVCPSSDGAACMADPDWTSGWVVWREDRTGGTVEQTVVRYTQPKAHMAITGPADGFEFTSRGRAEGGAATIQISPEGAEEPSRCVRVNATGQARVEQGACA